MSLRCGSRARTVADRGCAARANVRPDKGTTYRRSRAQGNTMTRPTINQCQIIDVSFGSAVKIVEPVNLYECTIGDDCFIGPFVEIQRGVTIGARTKVQSHSFICELVVIGKDCFVGHGVMFINDPFASGGPARERTELWRPTRIGNHVSIGSNATILPVNICDDAVIGAGAVVTRDIEAPGIYVGNPAQFLRAVETRR